MSLGWAPQSWPREMSLESALRPPKVAVRGLVRAGPPHSYFGRQQREAKIR